MFFKVFLGRPTAFSVLCFRSVNTDMSFCFSEFKDARFTLLFSKCLLVGKPSHPMKKILTIFLYLISSQVFGQQGNKIIVADFNKDGVVDTLNPFYDKGSSFRGGFVQIVNGKTNETFELVNDGECFCQIRYVVLISPALNKPKNALFLEAFKKHLLPENRTVPDPSLDWIIRSSFSRVKLDGNSFFDIIIDPQTSWLNEEFEYPYNYYVEITGDTLTQLYDRHSEAPKWFNKKESKQKNKGFLVYRAHNHYRNKSGDSLKLSASNSLYKVFSTSHGVFVKKGDTHKWVFMSDFLLTGAPGKLRWESIKRVKLFDKYLLIHQDLPVTDSYRLFVIDIETGILGRLKYSFSNHGDDADDELVTSSIEGESIILKMGEEQITCQLEEIFKALETFR